MPHEAPCVEVQVMSNGQWVPYCRHLHAHWDLQSAAQCQRQAEADGYWRGRVVWIQSREVAWWWPVDDGMSDVEPYDADRRDKERRGEL